MLIPFHCRGVANLCQFKTKNYCKKQNKLIVFNTNIFIKVDFIHKMSIFFYFNTSFLYHNTHVDRSFVISLSSRFTRSWCSQHRVTEKAMLMLNSKTLFFTNFHRIVHEKELPIRLRKKTEGPPNSSESSYQQNSSLPTD